MPPPRRPREAFGFSGATPLPGTERPLLSQTMEQRFSKAGLDPFIPYLNPYATLARAQQYRGFDRALQQEDLEDQFFQSIKENPQTGFQKFITENPESLMSPYVRSYISTRAQLQRKQQEDPFEAKAAEGGTRALEEFHRGGGGAAGFAAAQDFIAKNKPTKPDRPWQQRLSESEREKVREVVERAKALPNDFTTEFAAVKKENPDLTEEAYVQRFKGDPNLESYRKRRTFESAGPIVADLVDNYGLTEDEAVTALGIKQQPPARPRAQAPVPAVSPEQTAPAPAPVAAPQTSSFDGGPAAPAPVATPPVRDIRAIKELNAESLPTFESLAQAEKTAIESKDLAARREREREFLESQAYIKENTPKWESAKQDLLKNFRPEFANAATESEMRGLLGILGKKWNDVAFKETNGNTVTWIEVMHALQSDPRMEQVRNPQEVAPMSQSSAAPRKDYSSIWRKPKS